MLKPVEGNTKDALQNVCVDKNFLNRISVAWKPISRINSQEYIKIKRFVHSKRNYQQRKHIAHKMVGRSGSALPANVQNLPRTVKFKHTQNIKPKLSINLLGNEMNRRFSKDENKIGKKEFLKRFHIHSHQGNAI